MKTQSDITYLQDIANRYGNGTIAKAYNAKLGWGIIQTKEGAFQLFNEYGRAGERPTLAAAIALYDQMEAANSAYCYTHNC